MNEFNPFSPSPALPPRPADLPEAVVALVDSYPGPAIYTQEQKVIAANAAALVMIERGGQWWNDLASWLKIGPRAPETVRVPSETTPILVEWTAVPYSANSHVLLGRNITLERNLQEALTTSRDRFRDLVELTADLAWETNGEGVFSYIAGGKSLGYAPEKLLGRKAKELIVRQPLDPDDQFESEERLDKAMAYLRRADGTVAKVLISTYPLKDAKGNHRGTRGLCRDITDDSHRQEELAQIQRRDQLVAHFFKSLREAKEAKTALEIAAREICVALKASGCRIYNMNPNDELEVAIETGVALPEAVTTFTRRMSSRSTGVLQEVMPNAILMGMATLQSGQLSGAIWVWRPAVEGEWEADDKQLLTEVGDHLGIVITQIDYQEKLRVLSECDGLTKLLNRRTFLEKLEKSLRNSTSSALFYVDLDNFKAVNDTHGHQRGDQAIIKVAEILRDMGRKGDLVGRLGGDEFVLWMEGLDRKYAESIAHKLVSSGALLRDYSASAEKPLGMSVGLAMVPEGRILKVSALMERADHAMYKAKNSGKSTWAVAE